MALSIELPPPLEEELIIEAERERVSVSEQAVLLLHLMTAFTRDGRKTPFQSVVRAFLKQNEIDADRMASVCEGLMALCLQDASHPSKPLDELSTDSNCQFDTEQAQALLRGWRSPIVHRSVSDDVDISVSQLPRIEHMIQRAGRMPRGSVMGKYAWLKGSSEDFAREKQLEIAREDRPR